MTDEEIALLKIYLSATPNARLLWRDADGYKLIQHIGAHSDEPGPVGYLADTPGHYIALYAVQFRDIMFAPDNKPSAKFVKMCVRHVFNEAMDLTTGALQTIVREMLRERVDIAVHDAMNNSGLLEYRLRQYNDAAISAIPVVVRQLIEKTVLEEVRKNLRVNLYVSPDPAARERAVDLDGSSS